VLNLDDVRRRATITVPEAGQLLSLGRDSSYRAAARGEIPTLRLGRSLRVPVPKLLELIGIPQADSEASAPTDALAQPTPKAQEPPLNPKHPGKQPPPPRPDLTSHAH
jgi:excisionase family DNA binding protein